MDFLAIPPASGVLGEIEAPSSKSATNRALVLAAVSESPVEIAAPLESEDTIALRRCLGAMGARIEDSEAGLIVCGPLKGPQDSEERLDAGESGTAARFLLALAGVTPGRFLVTGSARLRQRPVHELMEALASGGASFQFRGEAGVLPVAVDGSHWRGGSLRVDASRSSQFLSALLLAGVAAPEGLEIAATGDVASAPYVALTLQSLRDFGHRVSDGPRFRVSRGDRSPRRYEVPGDYSSAVALLAAAGVVGGWVRVRGLAWPAVDADALALPVLEAMGVSIDASAGAVRAERRPPLRPVSVRATDFPDAVPALAALSAFAEGESRFEGIGHLRLKESDRIESLVRLLTEAGGNARGEPDALRVRGPILPGNGLPRRLPTANDHRIAMAGALLSLGLPSLLLENPGCVAKSYPDFFRDLERIVRR